MFRNAAIPLYLARVRRRVWEVSTGISILNSCVHCFVSTRLVTRIYVCFQRLGNQEGCGGVAPHLEWQDREGRFGILELNWSGNLLVGARASKSSR